MDAPYAQTNLQLYRQLRDAGFDEEELTLVRRGYETAMALFSSQFRANGKPFLSHLVGTASVLGRAGARPPVVVAGLLHAAYAQGNWPRGARQAARRQRLTSAVGSDVEALVHAYTTLPWNPARLGTLLEHAASLSGPEADVVLMRLANLLEDHLDEGMAYSAKGGARRAERYPDAIQIAKLLGHAGLARDLEMALGQNQAATIPEALRSSARASFTLGPKGATRGSKAGWRGLRRRARRAL